MKKLNKSQFCDFRSNKIVIFSVSEKSVKILKTWLYYLQFRMFIDKVKNFCDHSMILWEIAANSNFFPPYSLNRHLRVSQHCAYFLLSHLNFWSRFFVSIFENLNLKSFGGPAYWLDCKDHKTAFMLPLSIRSSVKSRVSNIESDNSQNIGLEDYNNISDEIFPHFTTSSIKISLG